MKIFVLLAVVALFGCYNRRVKTYHIEPIQSHPCVRYVTIDFARCQNNVCDGVRLIQDCVSVNGVK